MHWRILSVACLIVGLLAGHAQADEGRPAKPAAGEPPRRQAVKVELEAQPELILLGKGKTERSNIDSVSSPLPPAIAAGVKGWTGIADRGQTMTVKFFHDPHNARFDAASFASETFGRTSFLKFGDKVLHDEETHVRYKEVLAASDEKSFFVVGMIEFDNPKTHRRCVVLCQLEGQKPPAAGKDDPVIHPTGTATWTGPIVNASQSPLPGVEAAATGQ
jgi:hypothetical protein